MKRKKSIVVRSSPFTKKQDKDESNSLNLEPNIKFNQQNESQQTGEGSPPEAATAAAINKVHTCSGCNRLIKRERYLLSACDKFWHESCLKCDQCHAKLGELGSSLFVKSNSILCRQDFLDMFGPSCVCAVCEKLIRASEMVMRAKHNVYHLECFACQLCNQRFCVGDQFYLLENKVICQYDYEDIQRSMTSADNLVDRPPMDGGDFAPASHVICQPADGSHSMSNFATEEQPTPVPNHDQESTLILQELTSTMSIRKECSEVELIRDYESTVLNCSS